MALHFAVLVVQVPNLQIADVDNFIALF